MNHLLTYRAFGLIWVAILCVVVAVQLGCGCVMHKGVAEYGVDTFTIKVADRGTIQKEWDKHEAHKREQVRGFYDEMTRTIWVQPDGPRHPDLYTLGHEVWHLSELGGNWHE